MPITIKTMEDFIAEQGGPLIPLDDRGENFLARSGATMQRWSGRETFDEAPTDPVPRLKARREYHRIFLEKVTSCFQTTKRMVMYQQIGTAPWSDRLFGDIPSGGAKAALQHLVALATEHRLALREIETEWGALPEVKRQRAAEQAHKESQQQQEQARREALAEIDEIQLPTS